MTRFLEGRTALAAGLLILILVAAACSGDDSASDTTVFLEGEERISEMTTTTAAAGAQFGGGDEGRPEPQQVSDVATAAFDLRIIRDGRVDIRVDRGTFESSAAKLRTIAADLGGFLAQGDTHLEEIDEERYSVGWFTLRIPEGRFEEAISRLDGMGERLNVSLSSQDVTEEFVDLEGRLRYWRNQEAFYTKLLAEAETVQDLVTIQNQMQEVLLTIESIEGRLRYLDNRTTFATLTVGLTEIPGATPIDPITDPEDPGMITEALEQAGTVLLGTVGFLIVAAAFLLPLGVVALVVLLVARGILAIVNRKPADSEGAA